MNSKDLEKRKRGFNPNCVSYLTADGKYYCYEYWDPEANIEVTQRFEVGKDLSVELALMLDEFDHEMDLQDHYESELRDPLFDVKVNNYKADYDDEDAVDPWDTLAEKGGNPEDILFAESEPENPRREGGLSWGRGAINENCSESQQDFFRKHFSKGAQLEEMGQADAEQTE